MGSLAGPWSVRLTSGTMILIELMGYFLHIIRNSKEASTSSCRYLRFVIFLELLESRTETIPQKLSRQVLDTIQETIHHPSDCIKTQSEITTQLQTLIIYPQDMELILLFLERRGDITRTVSPKLHDCIIKFKFKLQSSAKPLQKVNEQEEGIAVLKFTALKIEKQADVLSKKVEE